MTSGRNLVLFGIVIFAFLFLFRLYCFRLNHKYGFRLVFIMYLSMFFFISFFCYFFRIYLFSRLGLHLGELFSFLILSVGVLPLPATPGPSSSSSWTEDSFEIGVLMEPFSETEMEGASKNDSILARDEAGPSRQPYIVHDLSLESSIKNRISSLENDNTIFLLDKERGEYWRGVKETLDQAPTQGAYASLLELENTDLQIRELKHACYSLFQEVLAEHPALSENAAYSPEELFVDFFNEKRKELDTLLGLIQAEREEIPFLDRVRRDIGERGPDSIYMREILEYANN